MTACAWEVIFRYKFDSFSFIWYVSIEVACISTFEALLLLILSCMHCHCNCKGCGGEEEEEDEKKGYNKVSADNSHSMIQEDTLTGKKKD